MAVSGTMTGFDTFRAALGRKAKQYERFPAFEIGFSAPYAIYVHENLEQKWKGRPRRPSPPKKGVYWGPAGGPKYLTRAIAKTKSDGSARRILLRELKAGNSLRHAALQVALHVLHEAQLNVPVDSGFLQDSGFVRSGGTFYGIGKK